jgi:hypothetical protein
MRSKVQKEINDFNKVLGNLTDKQHEQYVSDGHKKQNKERASKGGSTTLTGKGYTNTQKKGNQTYSEMKTKKYKSIIKLILKKEFTYSDMRYACDRFGINEGSIKVTAKRILKEKTLVKQIHKGYNQYDPSLYVKIK